MSDSGGKITCTLGCWLVALLGGVLAAALLWVLGGWSFMQGIFVAVVIFVIAGALLNWILCKPLPAANTASTQGASAGTAAAAKSAAAPAPSASAPEPEAAPAAAAATAPEAASEPAKADPVVKPSKALAGEAELASRKGDWKYEGDNGEPATSAKVASAPAATETATSDYDGDGKLEGAGEGERPAALDGPRDGKADDLKQIKGVGPKLEQLLHSMGFYHFDQIGNWTANEVAWVNANLEGFKGRVSRDNWVEQARVLAAGGETEFSKKVEKGGVYD